MSDQKYYTPELSDLFVGYECEAREIDSPTWEIWRDATICSSGFTMANAASKSVELRTPYLTREQIEAEGFTFVMDKTDYGTTNSLFSRDVKPTSLFPFTKIAVTLSEANHLVLISADISNDRGRGDVELFRGVIKSINEFRKICKMVGIEKKVAVNA